MVLDVIIVCIFLLFLLIGIKRGAAKTFLNVIAVVLSVVISSSLGALVSNWIYNTFFQQGVNTAISSSASQNNPTDVISNAITALPDQVYSVLSVFGINKDTLLADSQKAISSATTNTVTTTQNFIASILTSIISVFAVIGMFVLLMIIFKIIIRVIKNVFELPVLRQLNGLLGGILGAVEGVAIVFLIITIMKIMIPFSDTGVVTMEMINQSFIFKAIYNINIFSNLTNTANSFTLPK